MSPRKEKRCVGHGVRACPCAREDEARLYPLTDSDRGASIFVGRSAASRLAVHAHPTVAPRRGSNHGANGTLRERSRRCWRRACHGGGRRERGLQLALNSAGSALRRRAVQGGGSRQAAEWPLDANAWGELFAPRERFILLHTKRHMSVLGKSNSGSIVCALVGRSRAGTGTGIIFFFPPGRVWLGLGGGY